MSSPLFLLGLEALSRDTRSRCPEELFYGFIGYWFALGFKSEIRSFEGALQTNEMIVNITGIKMMADSEKVMKIMGNTKQFLCANSETLQE